LRIARGVGNTFRSRVEVMHFASDSETALDSVRAQYNSTVLLRKLLAMAPATGAKLIGITSLDLFSPALTFVFGEAQLDGRVAIASSYRLENTFYGLPDNPGLMLERLEKEAIHELGHTFDLTHCPDYNCVMHLSTCVEDVDLKGNGFCRYCSERIDGRLSW